MVAEPPRLIAQAVANSALVQKHIHCMALRSATIDLVVLRRMQLPDGRVCGAHASARTDRWRWRVPLHQPAGGSWCCARPSSPFSELVLILSPASLPSCGAFTRQGSEPQSAPHGGRSVRRASVGASSNMVGART